MAKKRRHEDTLNFQSSRRKVVHNRLSDIWYKIDPKISNTKQEVTDIVECMLGPFVDETPSNEHNSSSSFSNICNDVANSATGCANYIMNSLSPSSSNSAQYQPLNDNVD